MTIDVESLWSEVAASDALISKATEGPWFAVLYVDTYVLQDGPDYTNRRIDSADNCGKPDLTPAVTVEQAKANMEFCSHARTALPARNQQARELIERIKELERKLHKANAILVVHRLPVP